jgi:tRNA threonylcarbamoyladenosine biosynthesis protein TsaB
MFSQVDSLLRELSLDLRDFDLFAVAAGPGSFTGVRVGLAAVKAWAEAYEKPVAAVSALEAVAVQSASEAPFIVPVLDARRHQLYFGVYRRQGAPQDGQLLLDGDECVVAPEEFEQELRTRFMNFNFTIATTDADKASPTFPGLPLIPASGNPMRQDVVSGVLAPHIGRLGYVHARRGQLADALTLDANYIRRSDAELHLKEPLEP